MEKVGCKQVVDFMKKEGWYREYCDNILCSLRDCEDKNDKKVKRLALKELLCYNGDDAIASNLIWSGTFEGYEYWCDKGYSLRRAFRGKRLKYKTI